MMFISCKTLDNVPTRASSLCAGFDLSSATEIIVPARGKALVPTDMSIAVSEGTYARIAPRSGLVWKHSIVVGGVIDADYRGPVGGDMFMELEDLDCAARGAGDFGATGI
ncbi:hypothetical protein M0R45_027254 [Rubus argutus]|uniref:Deoxyuridine 5'-triphosphate nucleotidohydrolase n=1 Tax=Rubus argutus TaxID=59490 RepID=A0AAW1X0L4_RUBAR